MTEDDRIKNYERQLDRMLRDPDGRQLICAKFGLRISDAQDRDCPTVAVLMPSYGNPKPAAEKALEIAIAQARQTVNVHRPLIYGHSIVHWVRNEMIGRLLQNRVPFTHVLFVDDDIEIAPDSITRLLSHGKDIVGALCTVRHDPPIPTLRDFHEATGEVVQRRHWKPGELLHVDALGTGMMLISREALDKIGEFYLSCGFERVMFGNSPKLEDLSAKRRAEFTNSRDERWHMNACWFQTLPALSGRGEYGEDISFCLKARYCGIPVYCDTNVQPLHHGDYGYGVHDFLAYQHGLMEQQKASADAVR